MHVAATGGVTVRVPAKINLELIVGPRREDGYHGLSTVFHAVGLYDDVTVRPATQWGVSLSGPYGGLVPADGDNLALRAAQLLAARSIADAGRGAPVDADEFGELGDLGDLDGLGGVRDIGDIGDAGDDAASDDRGRRSGAADEAPGLHSTDGPAALGRPQPSAVTEAARARHPAQAMGPRRCDTPQLVTDPTAGVGPVHIHIAKEIPVAAGMAGGSADAAAALVACDALWRLGTDRGVLDELAAQLGSDVNFALTGGTAIGSGRGERVAPVLGRGRYHWVLVVSDQGLSTPSVFAECDRLRAQRGESDIPDPEPSPTMMAALRSGDPRQLGEALRNDLQEAALSLRPDLQEVLDAGLEYGALGGLVSGSGPTLAFLVDGTEGALDLAVALTASGVATDVKRAIGPAHGAHVLSTPLAAR